MATVIDTLNDQAHDPDRPVTELLSRAIVHARALRQGALVDWMKKEHDGYSPGDTLPDYRCGVKGFLVAWSPGHGSWIEAPVTELLASELSTTCLLQSVADIEKEFFKNRSSGGLRVDFPAERLAEIQQRANLRTNLALAVPALAHATALESVRGVIRHWVSELVQLGINASGFADAEREKAAALADRFPAYLESAAAEAPTWAAKASKRKGMLSRLLGFGG